MAPLRQPPADLSRFPRHRLSPEQALFRIHPSHDGPWWFDSSPQGRFSLSSPGGTCYLTDEPLAALLETCRGISPVAHAYIRRRRLSVLHVRSEVVLADCTAARAAGFGVTAAIHSTENYGLTRRWAEAFASAGFGGIQYLVSHDPRQRLAGLALFGTAGERDWPVEETAEIPDELIGELERRFGILVHYRAERL